MEESAYRPRREPLVPSGGIDCHVRDMTATVAADLTLAELQSRLGGQGQWLPIDGACDRTLGALISADSTGPLRSGYGGWRDLLLGVQFTNGQGQLITAGGRTVKNVAGYDLTKFMVGQHGIFGRLVTLTTRTYLRPAGALLARYRADPSIVTQRIATPVRPQWSVLTADALFCGYLGDDQTLHYYRGAVAATDPDELIDLSLEQDIARRAGLWRAAGACVFRASVPPARLHELAHILGVREWAADAVFGIVIGGLESEDRMQSVRERIRSVDGTVRFFRGAYGPPLEFDAGPAERHLIERLKSAFDPDLRLNPLPWHSS